MDIFKGIGDFFRGVFGGESEEEKRRKRAQQQQQQAARQAQQSMVKAAQPTQPQVQKTQPQPSLQTAPTQPKLTLNEFMAKPKPAAPQKRTEGPSLADIAGGAANVAGNVAKAVPTFVGDVAKNPVGEATKIAQAPFRALASIGQSINEALPESIRDKNPNSIQKGPVGRFVFGDEPIDNVVKQGQQLASLSLSEEDIKKGKQANIDPRVAALLGLFAAGTDVLPTGGAKKRIVSKATKETEDAVTKVVKDAEEKVGRQLTDEESQAIRNKVTSDIESATPKVDTKKATNVPTREDVGQSYADIYNKVTSDSSLTPQQKVDFLAEAKARHTEMLKQIDDSELAQMQAVEAEAKRQMDEQDALNNQVAEQQAAQQAAVTPPTGSMETPPAPQVNDVSVNDAVYRQMQDERAASRTQPKLQQAINTAKREVIDPRNIQQRLDNAEFKRLQQAGLIPDGQTELTGNQSLVTLRGLIENPGRAAELNDNVKYGDWSVNDIIRYYGNSDSEPARQFENYRLYKDEIERIMNGQPNTLAIDPEEMMRYVANYEAANPIAIGQNASLRQASLDLLRRMSEARIDDPQLYQAAQNFQFYNPRQVVDPDELIRPRLTGGVRSGAKQSEGRTLDEQGIRRSPLQVFKDRSVQVERALAQQQYDMLIRDMARRGEKGFVEVVNADTAVAHRQAIRNMRDLSQQIKELQAIKKGAKVEAKSQAKVDKAKADAINVVRQYLRDQATDEKSLKFADKIKDKEALDMFNLLTESGEVNAKRLINSIAKDSGIEADRIKEFITGVQNEIRDSRGARTDAWQNMIDTTQNLERGTQTITYKLDGETGKVEIPADLAEELSKANESINLSPLEKAGQAVGSIQKVTWTGALSPVFKVFNVLVKNPLLAYRNADGLSGVSPSALGAFIRSSFRTPGMQQFKQDMIRNGASYENALQTKNIYSTTADDIAARANLGSFFNRNPVSTLQDVWKGINQGLAHFDNAQRDAVAYGAYRRAIARGIPETQARQIAAQAPAKVFGDFDRVSRLARNAEIILPYSGAIQAGARALGRASKTKPLETAIKDATFLAAAAGFTAYSLGNNEEYYKDMIEAGKEYELDNNWTIVWPGATRDANGNWSGVTKIPLTPDLRPYNRAVWRGVMGEAADGGLSIPLVAGELFNEFTGDIANSIYDQSRTDNGNNPLNGILSSSALGSNLKTLFGVDPRTGNPLADENVARLDETQQATDYTSPGARGISQALGGALTPLQVDSFLAQMGNFGDVVQGKPDAETGQVDPLGNFFNFSKAVAPGKGLSDKAKDSKQYFKDIDAVAATIDPKDAKTFREFQALHSKKTEDQKNNLLTSSQKAYNFMQYNPDGSFTTTPLFEAEKKLDALARARGEAGNPIFDLGPQELQKVLTYRASKIYNAAKQNYTRNGEGAFQALGLDNKWYSDFQKAESAYYKTIFGDDDKGIRSFSGKSKPQLTPEQQQIETAYYSLPEKSAERRALLASNQWLKDYWADTNDFTNEERKALGFDQVEDIFAGSGGGGGYGDYVPLPEILNLASAKRLERLTGGDKKVALDIQRLFAPHRGGRASVSLGASSRGQG